jgi:signal transduction histidine kinase
LGRLGGGVAHELRTPLGAIKNVAYFLNMALEAPTPEIEEALGILNCEVDTCERVVAELLDFGRSRPPELQSVNLNRAIKQALHRADIPDAIDTKLELAEPLPMVKADPNQVAQVLGNLVYNALQAMPEGGRLIIRSAPEEANWVSISVTDTGVGIPKSEIPKLFEPLYTTKATGIGLGLAISRTLVEGHGGTIAVRSQEGQGSTFKVRFPAEEAWRES